MSTLLADAAKSIKPPSHKARPLKIIAAALIVAVGVGFIAFAFGGKDAAQRDYICYWAAGQELTHHGNPYDGATIMNLQRSVGYEGERPFFMRNPPTAFAFVAPLGFVGMRTGAVLWSLAIVGCLMISLRLLWIMNGRPPDRLFMVGYLFVPVVPCLHQGQTGIFLLFGVVLFFYFCDSRPFLAGAVLLLPSLKPHLFLPIGIALLGWIVTRKAYRVLAGWMVALSFSSLFAYFLDPSCWSQYSQMVKLEKISGEFIPTVSLAFRHAIDSHAVWLQLVPVTVGCVWATFYFFKNRDDWNWNTNGSLVLLVSIMVAPYYWLPDESIVLPAIIAGLYIAAMKGRSLIPFCILIGIGFMELALNFATNSGAYIWTAPAWLIWYLFATRLRYDPNMYDFPPEEGAATTTVNA